MYKYDLGHTLLYEGVDTFVKLDIYSVCAEIEREREREVVASIVTAACGEESGCKEVIALVLPLL